MFLAAEYVRHFKKMVVYCRGEVVERTDMRLLHRMPRLVHYSYRPPVAGCRILGVNFGFYPENSLALLILAREHHLPSLCVFLPVKAAARACLAGIAEFFPAVAARAHISGIHVHELCGILVIDREP